MWNRVGEEQASSTDQRFSSVMGTHINTFYKGAYDVTGGNERELSSYYRTGAFYAK